MIFKIYITIFITFLWESEKWNWKWPKRRSSQQLFRFFFYRYRDPCSASLNEDDNHTIKLIGNANRKAITLAKTCEQTVELRDCRAPRDWSILALQNTRTGKSHYLIICKCPPQFRLGKNFPHFQLFAKPKILIFQRDH